MDNARDEIFDALKMLATPMYPTLGIDIDGCIDESPIFFCILASRWPGKVLIISYRNDYAKAEAVLIKYDIQFDELILVKSFDEKAKVIKERGIGIFFDDQPEMLKEVSPSCQVMLVRNGGNFDFDDQRWVMSEETGKLI